MVWVGIEGVIYTPRTYQKLIFRSWFEQNQSVGFLVKLTKKLE